MKNISIPSERPHFSLIHLSIFIVPKSPILSFTPTNEAFVHEDTMPALIKVTILTLVVHYQSLSNMTCQQHLTEFIIASCIQYFNLACRSRGTLLFLYLMSQALFTGSFCWTLTIGYLGLTPDPLLYQRSLPWWSPSVLWLYPNDVYLQLKPPSTPDHMSLWTYLYLEV